MTVWEEYDRAVKACIAVGMASKPTTVAVIHLVMQYDARPTCSAEDIGHVRIISHVTFCTPYINHLTPRGQYSEAGETAAMCYMCKG